MAEGPVGAPSDVPPTVCDNPHPTLSQRDQDRIEFYKTYDVMTGVRIAATLGGFFGLMVMLVVYKSKCKSRSLSDEHLETVAAAVIEEEEAIALDALNLFGPRRSLGNMSAPTGPYPRFSSLGGNSLLNPPTRLVYGQRARVSIPSAEPKYSSPPRLTITSPTLKTPYTQEEEEEEDDDYPCEFLQVPSRRASRRLSSITCSSADTSYLERRGSAVEVGLPPAPALRRPPLPHEHWDFYYPIDIQVIQPTPMMSPCTSEGVLYDQARGSSAHLKPPSPTPVRLAPLASISSCRTSAPVSPSHSLGSDSVFLDEECIDTEDEADEFSTDSDVDDYEFEVKRPKRHTLPSSVPFAEHVQVTGYPRSPAVRYHGARHPRPPQPLPLDLPSTPSSSDTLEVSRVRAPLRARPVNSLSCDHLVKALSEHDRQQSASARDLVHCSWSQETLF